MKRPGVFSSPLSDVVLALIVGHLVSCAPQPKPAPVPRPDLSIPRQFLAAGDFQHAIDTYQALWEQFTAEKTVRDEYIQALEQIKTEADKFYQAKNFRPAVRAYSVLLENFPRFETLGQELSFRPELLRRQIRRSQAAEIELEAARALEGRDFEKAVSVYLNPSRLELRMPELESGWRRTAEEVMRRSEEAEGKEDLITAGKGYAALLKNLALLGKTKPPPPFSRGDLEARLNTLRNRLTRRGLEDYRRGNLREAIAVWQGLLEFDPGNAEIKKAVETATEQLKKLKKDVPAG